MTDRRPTHILSSYCAPRGAHRMYALGQQLAQMYLSPNDKLIGIIGEAGSGKSALIRGMFPGLELTNDDNGVYIRPLPLLDQDHGFAFFSPHTYHLDVRFENGFTQMNVLADAIAEALDKGRRVIVEHFDLISPLLGANANLLIGIGEQEAEIPVTYLYAKISLNKSLDTVLAYKTLLEETFEELSCTEISTTIQLVGDYAGYLPLERRNEITEDILDALGAEVVYEYREHELYTVYAYTAGLDNYITVDNKKINVHIAMSQNEEHYRTVLYLASPILPDTW